MYISSDARVSHSNTRQITIWKGNPIIENNNITQGHRGIEIEGGHPTIANNTITNNVEGLEFAWSDPLIFNNTISYNRDWGLVMGDVALHRYRIENNRIYGNGGGGVCVDETGLPGKSIIANNSIHMNGDCGILCGGSPLITNNTIHSNNGDGIYVYLRNKPTIKNNLIYNNTGWGIRIQSDAEEYQTKEKVRDNIFMCDGRGNVEGGLLVEWCVMINLYDEDYNYVNGTLTITDATGEVIYHNQTTYVVLYITEYEIENNGKMIMHTPHKLKAEYQGRTVTLTININRSLDDITLQFKDDTPFLLYGLTITCSGLVAAMFWRSLRKEKICDKTRKSAHGRFHAFFTTKMDGPKK